MYDLHYQQQEVGHGHFFRYMRGMIGILYITEAYAIPHVHGSRKHVTW